jgi:hypothetical protein
MKESNDQVRTSDSSQILIGVLACAVATMGLASLIVWHWVR